MNMAQLLKVLKQIVSSLKRVLVKNSSPSVTDLSALIDRLEESLPDVEFMKKCNNATCHKDW